MGGASAPPFQKRGDQKMSIKVIVQKEDRIKAINELAMAIKHLALALSQETRVEIKDVKIYNKSEEPAIKIDTAEDVTETIIKEGGQ